MAEHTLMADAVVAFRDVTLARSDTNILTGLTWSVEPEDRWVVLGPNGAGKTTLLCLAAARMHPSQGQVWVLGEQLGKVDVFELRPRLGLCSASVAENIPPDERVHDTVMTSAYAVLGRFQEEYAEQDNSRSHALLAQWGVAHLAHRTFGTLSEGERKRVQIARALMSDPEVLLLDEPAAGLDLGGREDLVKRLASVATDPAAPAVIMVTHHVEEIPPGITHALLLREGQVVAQGKAADVITSELLTATFGAPLVVQHENDRFFARAI